VSHIGGYDDYNDDNFEVESVRFFYLREFFWGSQFPDAQ